MLESELATLINVSHAYLNRLKLIEHCLNHMMVYRLQNQRL